MITSPALATAEHAGNSLGRSDALRGGAVVAIGSVLALAWDAAARSALPKVAALVLMATAVGTQATSTAPLPSAGPISSTIVASPALGVDPAIAGHLPLAPDVAGQLDLSPVVEPLREAAPAPTTGSVSGSQPRPAAGAGSSAGTTTQSGTTTQTVPAGPPATAFACPQSAAPAATSGGGELLRTPWRVHGPPSQECYQGVATNAIMNATNLRITEDLHGATALGADAAIIVLDQGSDDKCVNAPGCRWHFVSIANYGRNGFDGQQTVTVPLSAFPGLDRSQPLDGILHMRWWSQSPFTVDILSVVVS